MSCLEGEVTIAKSSPGVTSAGLSRLGLLSFLVFDLGFSELAEDLVLSRRLVCCAAKVQVDLLESSLENRSVNWRGKNPKTIKTKYVKQSPQTRFKFP